MLIGTTSTQLTTTPNSIRSSSSRYVRGNADYGVNDFVDNGDGTVADDATGLMWSQTDSGAVGGDIRLMWRLEVGDVKCETWG